jgi:hypothetical protein
MLFGYFAAHVRIDADFSSLLPADPKLEELRRAYGESDKDSEVLVLAARGPDLFTVEKLALFGEALRVIEEGAGALGPALSPFNLPRFSTSGFFEPLSPSGAAPRDAEELASFKEALASCSYARNLVVSSDGSMLAGFFDVRRSARYAEAMAALGEARGILASGGLESFATGAVPFVSRTGHYIAKDLLVLLCLACAIIAAFYFLGSRSLRGTVLPFIVVLAGTVWTMGFMSMLGYALSLVSVVIPPLIIALGSEYAIHVLNEYYRAGCESLDWRSAAFAAFRGSRRGVFLACATTVAGFLSLIATPMPKMREFALVSSFSFVSCAALSLFALPAALSLMADPRRVGPAQAACGGFLSRLMEAIARLVERRGGLVLAGAAALFAAAGFSAGALRFNTDAISYFPADDPVMEDMRVLSREIGGFSVLNLSLAAKSGEAGFFRKPENVERGIALQAALLANPDISFSFSFPRLVEELGKARPEQRIEASIRQTATLLRGAEASGGMGMLGNLVNEDYTRITYACRVYNSESGRYVDEARVRAIAAYVEACVAASGFGPEVEGHVWGQSLQSMRLSGLLRDSLLQSIALSLCAVLAISCIAFASLKLGALSVLPLLFGLSANVSIAALLGIPLDVTTIMVSSIAIGVGVDHAIHFLCRYREYQRAEGLGAGELIAATLAHTGRPIALSSACVVAGLSVFAFASFKPVFFFGVLVVSTLSAAAIGTLLLLPACIRIIDRKKAR